MRRGLLNVTHHTESWPGWHILGAIEVDSGFAQISASPDGAMASKSDDKPLKSAYSSGKGRVVKDDMGRQSWQGTIRTVKLSLMKTGIFFRSEAQQRLTKLREAANDNADSGQSEELDITDDSSGSDPYNSGGK